MKNIYALHGFLGKPSDWQKSLPNAAAVDLFRGPVKNFEEWAKQFNASVLSESFIVGYSLGGRLALHALIQNPKVWKGAVIISANPGLANESDRQQRIIHDRKWAKRFLNDPWEKLMDDWNNQTVFSSDKRIERKESDFDRAILSAVMEEWSLGKQRYLPPLISALPVPILWITGERDPKAARGLAFAHPKSRELTIPLAGHRVPWDNFQEQFQQFLGEIE